MVVIISSKFWEAIVDGGDSVKLVRLIMWNVFLDKWLGILTLSPLSPGRPAAPRSPGIPCSPGAPCAPGAPGAPASP